MISRRSLPVATSAAALGLGAALSSVPIEFPPHDPLLAALTKYRRDLDTFNRSAHQTEEEDEALMKATWEPFWSGVVDGEIVLPAPTTMAGEVMALRCTLKEENLDAFEEALIRAVLTFLEGSTA